MNVNCQTDAQATPGMGHAAGWVMDRQWARGVLLTRLAQELWLTQQPRWGLDKL